MKILEVVIEGDMPECCSFCELVCTEQSYGGAMAHYWCPIYAVNNREDLEKPHTERHPDCPLVERKKE